MEEHRIAAVKRGRHAWLEYQRHHSSPAVASSHIHHGPRRVRSLCTAAARRGGKYATSQCARPSFSFGLFSSGRTEGAPRTRHKVLSESPPRLRRFRFAKLVLICVEAERVCIGASVQESRFFPIDQQCVLCRYLPALLGSGIS